MMAEQVVYCYGQHFRWNQRGVYL